MTIQTPWLTREEAATYCKTTAKTLANYANMDPPKGPPFWNPEGEKGGGRVRYHTALLDKWMFNRESVPHGLQKAAVSIDAANQQSARRRDPEEAFWSDLALSIELGLMADDIPNVPEPTLRVP